MINPLERLGNPAQPGGIDNLKNHPFFEGCDFSNPKSLCLTIEQQAQVSGDFYGSPIRLDKPKIA